MTPPDDRGRSGRRAAKQSGAVKGQPGATAATAAPARPAPIMELLVLGTARLAANQLARKIGLHLSERFRLVDPTRIQWAAADARAKPASGGYARKVSTSLSRKPKRSAGRAASHEGARFHVAGGEVREARAEISLERVTAASSVAPATSAQRVAVVDLTPVAPPAVGASASANTTVSKLLAEILDRIRELRRTDPSAAVLALVDTSTQHVIAQALSAGADEILLSDDVESGTQVSARVQTAIARAANRADPAGSTQPSTVAGATPRARGAGHPAIRQSPSAAPSEAELTAALAQVDDLAGTRLTVEQRAARAGSVWNDVLAIVAPSLRNDNGRLDAKRIAERLGVSVAALAQAIGKQRQTVNKTPDADDLQPALAPMAHVVSLLDDALAPNELTAWLSSSHAGLGGATPRAEILAGRASRVALMLESALGGGA
jgi:DNA-binding NarL/FixJ family response regulator